MSDQIGAALKENPRLPGLNKDAPLEAAQPQPSSPQPQPGREPAIPATTSEAAAKALLPDFSKLAFGQQVEKDTAKLATPEEPAPVKKETAVEDFPVELPGQGTSQAQATWARMRTSNQALAKQNSDLTMQLKDLQAKLKEFDGKTPMATDEFERITAEREELSKELRLSKLEATPEYKRAVAKPMQVVEDEIKRLGTKYNISSGRIREALLEADRDKQGDLLSKVTDTFNDRDKLTLFKLSDDAREVLRRRTVLQQDAKQALDYIEAKRAADADKAKSERTAEWSGAQKKAWKVIGDELYLARPLEGNEEWNKGLKETQELVANTDLDALDHIDRAKVLVQAALLPRALIAIHQLWNMYQDASKGLKRYQGVTPGAGGGHSSGGEPGPEPTNGEKEMSFVDAIEAKIRGVRH